MTWAVKSQENGHGKYVCRCLKLQYSTTVDTGPNDRQNKMISRVPVVVQ